MLLWCVCPISPFKPANEILRHFMPLVATVAPHLVLFWQVTWRKRELVSGGSDTNSMGQRSSLQANMSSSSKKFPAFYGIRRVMTASTRSRRLSRVLSHVDPVHAPHPTSLRSILILFSHLRLGLTSGFLPQVFSLKPCTLPYSPPYVLRAPPISVGNDTSPAYFVIMRWCKDVDKLRGFVEMLL